MNKREIKKDDLGNNEYCPWLTIPMLVLTEEEKALEITTERISEYHNIIGEDFLEYSSTYIINRFVFGGYLIGKFPEKASEIIEIVNSPYYELINFYEIFPFDDEIDQEGLYQHVIEFANLTVNTKARFNEILISVKYHDMDEDDEEEDDNDENDKVNDPINKIILT